ncbi:cytochrome P450 127A1 [Mycobacterium tuberculosis]|nr:cytochrome P450 127A1 [Mycobacterium tuberculosis]
MFVRQKNPHISFGAGIHRCLGRHFARLRLEIAFNRLLARHQPAGGPRYGDQEDGRHRQPRPEEMHLVLDRVAAPVGA